MEPKGQLADELDAAARALLQARLAQRDGEYRRVQAAIVELMRVLTSAHKTAGAIERQAAE